MEPIRCFTCNAVLRFATYERESARSGGALGALTAMGVRRTCCRRMYLSHPVDLEQAIRTFPLKNTVHGDYAMRYEADEPVLSVPTD